MSAPPAPDESPDFSQGATRQDALDAADDASRKAKLDDAELNVGVPKALQKVDLDLDGAPFLEEPAAPQEAPEAPAAPSQSLEVEAPGETPFWKKKKFLLIAGGALVVILALTAWLVLRKPAPPPPPPVEETPAPAQEPEQPPAPEEKPEQFYVLDPFLVEKPDDKGHIRLITLKIKLGYKDEQLADELKRKNLVLRDGLYYNLKNKSFGNLTDKKAVDTLRDELKGVVDNYLNTGQIEEVLFDDLLVK
jgi:flagellar FliL protein